MQIKHQWDRFINSEILHYHISNAILLGMIFIASKSEENWQFLEKLKRELEYDPAIPLCIDPKEPKTRTQRHTYIPVSTATPATRVH